MSDSVAIPIRVAVLNDRAFVQDSWFRSFESEYFDEMRRRLRSRLAAQAARSKILIACDPDDADTLLGFAILEGTKLHYVYVRGGMRRVGIARRLLSSVPIETFSTTTSMFRSRIKPDERGWKHDTENPE
jgi:hypothetical protein